MSTTKSRFVRDKELCEEIDGKGLDDSKFHANQHGYLVTYKGHVEKEALRKFFNADIITGVTVKGKVEEFMVAHEWGTDRNYPHTHAVVMWSTKFESRNCRVFDWNGEYETRDPNPDAKRQLSRASDRARLNELASKNEVRLDRAETKELAELVAELEESSCVATVKTEGILHPNIQTCTKRNIVKLHAWLVYLAKEDKDNIGAVKSQLHAEEVLTNLGKERKAGNALINNACTKSGAIDWKAVPGILAAHGPMSELESDKEAEEVAQEDLEKFTPRPIQQWLYEMMDLSYDGPRRNNRKVHLVYDKQGNIGKSTFVDWVLALHGEKVCAPNTTGDMGYATIEDAVKNRYNKKKDSVAILDLPRGFVDGTETRKALMFIESLMNGHGGHTKYAGKSYTGWKPHIWIFCNRMPNLSNFSMDRWVIHRVREWKPVKPVKKRYYPKETDKMVPASGTPEGLEQGDVYVQNYTIEEAIEYNEERVMKALIKEQIRKRLRKVKTAKIWATITKEYNLGTDDYEDEVEAEYY